jgi:hypothetical protein
VERTAADDPRPVEVAAVEDEPEPLDDLQDPLPGTPFEELALYQRPAPAYEEPSFPEVTPYDDEPVYADAGAGAGYPEGEPDDAAPEYAKLQNHAEPQYLDPDDFGDEYPEPPEYPAMELATAEYALPGFARPRPGYDDEPPPQGQFDAMLTNGDSAHPRDTGHRLPRAALAVVGAVLALIGLGGILLKVASGATTPAAATPAAAGNTDPVGDGAGSPPADAGSGAGSGAAEVTAARDGRTSASFELVSSASSVDVRVDDLGDDLYRISTPPGSPVRPDAATDGDAVRLTLAHTGPDNGPTQVGVVLNSQVQWTLRIAGGVETGTLDLRGGRIDGVDLTGGAGRFDLSLSRPKGTLSVRMSGGVNVFQMETDGEVPVRVTARSGAGQIILDGTTNNGVARGASFRSPGWSAQADRIDLDAVAGFGTLRVSHD